jgi:hypothetical protein
MRLRSIVLSAACVGLLAASPGSPGAPDVYRWVDANGVVHYTQVAPRDVPFERVSPSGRDRADEPSFYNPVRARSNAPGAIVDAPSVEAGDPDAASAPGLTPEQLERQSELSAEADARLAEIAEARRRNCELARQQFREFTTYARIRIANPDGSIRILTEEERASRLAETEEAIVVNCDGAG